MNERQQWKADYNELSDKIRKQKQLVKETDRKMSKIAAEENVTHFHYASKMSRELGQLWSDLSSASFSLYILRREAHNKMLTLPDIKERAQAEWENKNAK